MIQPLTLKIIGKEEAVHNPSNIVPMAVSVTKAATVLGLCKSHMYNLMNDGLIPFAKIGKRRLIRTADLEAFLARSMVQVAA